MIIEQSKKASIVERVAQGEMTIQEGAERLKLSERQILRLKATFLEKGPAAFIHGNTGRSPSNRFPNTIREEVKNKAKGAYEGGTFNHLSELLARYDDIIMSSKTVGRILQEAGISSPKTHKGPKKRKGRPRRPRKGELVQMDASFFDWFETGENFALHGAIDDATSTLLSLRMEKNECLKGYLHVLGGMVRQWGIPASVYADRHTIFVSPNKDKLTIEDELEGREAPLTQYGKALDLLGIGQTSARSPQAKGRVERLWNTLQDRLVLEMRIRGISTPEEANAFFPEYIEKYHNPQFSVEASSEKTAFHPCPCEDQLWIILGTREERKATGTSEISWHGEKYQLTDKQGNGVLLRRGEKITVIHTLDGSMVALRKDDVYPMKLSVSLKDLGKEKNPPLTEDNKLGALKQPQEVKEPYRPSKDHPWRKSFKKKHHDIPEDSLCAD